MGAGNVGCPELRNVGGGNNAGFTEPILVTIRLLAVVARTKSDLLASSAALAMLVSSSLNHP